MLNPPDSMWCDPDLPTNLTAFDVFTGYLMLDTWIANQDRLHENWGALWGTTGRSLAPTFDHGATLARNLRDTERIERLTTRDKNRTVTASCSRGRSAMFESTNAQQPMKLLEAFRAFASRAPQASEMWLARLTAAKDDDVWRVLERVPGDRMSSPCRQFTFELLRCNRTRLVES